MNDADLRGVVERLRAAYRGVSEQYINLITEKFIKVPGPVFALAVDLAIDGRDEKDKPTIPELWRFVSLAREKLGQGSPVKQTCARCGGTGITVDTVRNTASGETFDAAKPCTSCRKPWTLRRDLELVSKRTSAAEDSDAWCIEEAGRLSPSQVIHALKVADSLGIKYSEPVMKALIDRSIQGEPEKANADEIEF